MKLLKTIVGGFLASVCMAQQAPMDAYSKFEFIPGEDLQYFEDFSAIQLGNFPRNWNSTGNAQVVQKEGANWLKIDQNTVLLPDVSGKHFEENFTIEMDWLLQTDEGARIPQVVFGFVGTGSSPANSTQMLQDFWYLPRMEVKLMVEEESASSMELVAVENDQAVFSTGWRALRGFNNALGKPMRISIQVQGKRIRLWVNEEKAFDLPRAVLGTAFNQLYFSTSDAGFPDEYVGMHVSGIRVAATGPDLEQQLSKGGFTTSAIRFAVNSADIDPTSYALLKQIGSAIKQVNKPVRIVGHTDSDGKEEVNLELSKRRSEAVARILISEFGVDATLLVADGKGELDPIAPNSTPAGKAQNRRVEFLLQ